MTVPPPDPAAAPAPAPPVQPVPGPAQPPPAPAVAPRSGRRRLWAVLAVVVLLAAAGAAALLATGGRDPEPAPAPPTPTAAPPTPAPATPQEQAAADLDALVRGYRAVEDRVYLDPALDPGQAFDPYLRWPASEEAAVRVLNFRREGNTITSTSTEVHGVQVTALDLAAAPATATVAECKTLTVAGTDPAGQPQSGTNPRRQVEWTAKTLPDGAWRLYTATAQGDNSC